MAVFDWTLTGLIPTSGLHAWHLYDAATSTSSHIEDASGNGYHLEASGVAPVLTANAHNGQPGWLFNGTTTEPMQTTTSANFDTKHVFVYASYADAAFTVNNRGLLTGKNSGTWLVSEDTGTQMFSFGADFDYRKSGVSYADDLMEAPMGGIPELMEMTHPTFETTDGFQIGQQTADPTRLWKGYFHEGLYYDRILTGDELLSVYLYFNIKYQANRQGLPLRFPHIDIIPPAVTFGSNRYTRFREVPEDFDRVTDRWQYEDGMEDFNEVSNIAPKRWEVTFKLHDQDQPTVMAQKAIFDNFYRTARKAIPFTFRDKWGVDWADVRIEEYDNNHEAHRSWEYDIFFRLKTNTGTVVPAGTLASAGAIIDDLTGEFIVDG